MISIGNQTLDTTTKFNIFDVFKKPKDANINIGGITHTQPIIPTQVPQVSIGTPTKPTISNVSTPTQPTTQGRGPTNLFSDEKEAYNKMIADGLDDATSRKLIGDRRKTLLKEITQEESQALQKMMLDGLDAKTATEFVKQRRNDKLPLWKKALKFPFDASVGALGMVSEQVGNVAGFLGAEGMQQTGQELRQIGKQITGDSLGAKTGEFITGAGEILATGPAKVAPTLAGRIWQGALVGGVTGAGMPILEKGNETTAGDIVQGGLIGGTVGAVATPVLEKAVIPAISKVVQKGMKYGQAGLRGGITGVGKSIGRDVQRGIIKPIQSGLQKQGANISLGGIINPAKLDAVKKQLIVDEGVATPQDVGTWLLTRIKPGNKQEIADQLIIYSNKTKGAVDESLAKIPTRFQNDNARKALQQLEQDLLNTPGMEGELARIQNLLKKTDYSLSELQEVKRELDNIYNIYKQSGEVSAGLKAQGLNNIRRDIKTFIEDKAREFGVDIKRLNNDTAIARGLAEGIMKKDNADAVRELLNAFAPSGVGSVIGAGQSIAQGNDPLTVLRDAVIGGVIAKGLTSTRVRTNIGALLNKLGPKEMSQLEKFIKSGGTDIVGKKVAQDLIRRGRLLPSPGQTTIKPINLPAKGKLAKDELARSGKIGNISNINKNVTNNTNSLNTNNNNILLKKPLTVKKVLTKPQTQVLTSDIKGLKNPTPENITSTIEKSLGIKGKTEQIKKIVTNFIKREGEKRKEKIGDLLDEIATKIGAKLNFISDKGTGISGKIDTPKELIEEAKKYKSVENFEGYIKKKYKDLDSFSIYDSKDAYGDKYTYLKLIKVNKDSQGKGIGTKVMNELIYYADKNKVKLVLDPAVKDKLHGTTSRSRLVDFYKRFGFKENKGSNYNASFNEITMVRTPKDNLKQIYEQAHK